MNERSMAKNSFPKKPQRQLETVLTQHSKTLTNGFKELAQKEGNSKTSLIYDHKGSP